MDFELTDDQRSLADLVRTIVSGRFPLERIRRAEEARQVVDADDWAALGEAGVFSLTVPEDRGGVGLGLADAAVVFEELGRGLVPGPLVASHLAAGIGAAGIGAAGIGAAGIGAAGDEVPALAGAADGTAVVGAVRRPAPGSGEPLLVEHLDSLAAVVVVDPDGGLAVVAGDELAAVRAGAVPVERSLDPLTPLSVVADLPPGSAIPGGQAGGPVAVRWARDHQVLTGALCAGMAAATCGLAVDYAKGREQFGRPIGSFQAVKHLCADMLVRAETARAAVEAAAVTADQPDVGDADRAAAGAALLAAEAALANAKTCIQVHGGMGFTWEVPAHLYLMRARVLASSLPSPAALAGAVAARY
ncbi:MAG TPA: acyl-CoA dehydrogenase family protein [Acidimicrobiales bacterium]|nr:acyl-CoA dehydrogenase family protein [Acidimicrobiales bacterium]